MQLANRPLTLRQATAALCAASVAVSAIGCARTVLVNDEAPIRLGPNVRGRVYVFNGKDWELSMNSIALPEGFYLVPPRFVDGPEDSPPAIVPNATKSPTAANTL
jgi:hypothetical protein